MTYDEEIRNVEEWCAQTYNGIRNCNNPGDLATFSLWLEKFFADAEDGGRLIERCMQMEIAKRFGELAGP